MPLGTVAGANGQVQRTLQPVTRRSSITPADLATCNKALQHSTSLTQRFREIPYGQSRGGHSRMGQPIHVFSFWISEGSTPAYY